MCPITVIIKVSFEDSLVSFSLQLSLQVTWFGLVVAMLMAFLKNALMHKRRNKVKLFNHDCLPILILLYIMLYIVLAFLKLFAALSNAACLHNAFIRFLFFAIDFWKWLLFSCFVLAYRHVVYLFQVLFCIMHSVFNMLVFPNSMFTQFFK